MTDLQNKYDMLLEDIKILLQYDDKYIKIDKTNIVKPNKLNELEKQIGNIKQKQSGIKLQIKNNNDNKELITNEIRIINEKQNNIEKEITELNNNTKIIQEEQQSKLDLINLKCKELDELSDTTQNQVYKDIIKQILKVVNNNCILLKPNIINENINVKAINNFLIEMYLLKDSFNKLFIEDNNKQIEQIDKNNIPILMNINILTTRLLSSYRSNPHHPYKKINSYNLRGLSQIQINDIMRKEENNMIENDSKIIEYRKHIEDNNNRKLYLQNLTLLHYSKINIFDKISKTINYINNISSKLQILDKSIDNLFSSKNDKLLFTNYILSTLTIINLEKYNFGHTNYEEIIYLQNKINETKIKLTLLNNTDIYINYIKELNKQNIEIEDNDNYYIKLIIDYEFKINKLKKTILELEEMEIEISNQIKENNNKGKNIDTIEQHMRLTKLLKNLKKEIKDNNIKKSKLEINAKEEYDICNFEYKNEYIKKITELQTHYLTQLTNIIKQALNKTIDQITIENLNIYDIELQESKDKIQQIISINTTINNILIDVNTSNCNNIKQIQTYIEKEINLNNIFSKNEELIKQKNNDIEKIEMQHKLLDLEFDAYNIEISKLEIEFTTLEKVYNLRLHYSS